MKNSAIFCHSHQEMHLEMNAYKTSMMGVFIKTTFLEKIHSSVVSGVSVFSSSKKGHLWPVYLAINKLPIEQR